MPNDACDARARTLGAVCRALGEDVALDPCEAAAHGLTWAREPAAPDAETLNLACACVAAGREYRARQWDALGDFLALVGMPVARSTVAQLAERLPQLPTRAASRLVAAAGLLGWGQQPRYADGDSFFGDNDARE